MSWVHFGMSKMYTQIHPHNLRLIEHLFGILYYIFPAAVTQKKCILYTHSIQPNLIPIHSIINVPPKKGFQTPKTVLYLPPPKNISFPNTFIKQVIR